MVVETQFTQEIQSQEKNSNSFKLGKRYVVTAVVGVLFLIWLITLTVLEHKSNEAGNYFIRLT